MYSIKPKSTTVPMVIAEMAWNRSASLSEALSMLRGQAIGQANNYETKAGEALQTLKSVQIEVKQALEMINADIQHAAKLARK